MDQAIGEFSKAIKLDEKQAIFFNNRGLAYFHDKHID